MPQFIDYSKTLKVIPAILRWCMHYAMISLLICCYTETQAQSNLASPNAGNIIGAPFIRNYTPEEYKAHNQNWAIIQGKRGVIFVGNNNGVLEYDGVSWRIIPIGLGSVRSLAIDESGTLYVGTFGDFGYLAPDSTEKLHYVSLLPKVDKKYHEFADVWQTLSTTHGIYFVSLQYIFRWDGERIHVWNAKNTFHTAINVNDRIYVRQREVGLMYIDDDSLVMAPMGEKFADERIMAMFPYPAENKKTMILATRTNGLLLYDGINIKPFVNEANEILQEGQLYCGTQLSNGNYAFGTIQNGVVVIDVNGRLLYHLNKNSGLQDETIWNLYEDKQGGLWIGMHVGISRAEISSSLTYFGTREGVEGSVLEIVRHEGVLYLATSMGIYYLDERTVSTNSIKKFQRISGVSPQCWALMPFRDVLLAGAFDGVYEIKNKKGTSIDSVYVMSLHRSVRDPNRVYVGLQSGFKSLYYTNGNWRDEGLIEGVNEEIINIQETPEGKLWLTARFKGLILLDFSKGYNPKPAVMTYDTLEGLPTGERKFAFYAGDKLRFATASGFYQFDEKAQKFFEDTTIIKGDASEYSEIFSITKNGRNDLLIVGKGALKIASLQTDNSYKVKSNPFLRISNFEDYYAYADPLNPDKIWLGAIDRVIRIDASITKKDSGHFRTLIREVLVNGDSVLYGGAGYGPESDLILKHGYKSLRFKFAAPSFDEESKTEYQFILEGFDNHWSSWSTETYKDYTGLPTGYYKFLVRSRNIHQQLGETAVVEFRILPPFYLTGWAFLVYAIILLVAIYFLWQRKLASVQKRHGRELKQLEYDKLKELDQLKSRFFANISHEFRTPLTLILGPADNLLSNQPTAEQAKQCNTIKRNAQRLLRLINQLLDLSKLEAGKMTLDLQHDDIISLIRGIVHSFESLVQSNKINLSFTTEVQNAFLDYDRDKLEQVLTNLISNAVKFTDEGGSVIIDLRLNEKDHEIRIDVKDTGLGISKVQLPFVFDRFYQGSEASQIGEPGTGIGLALAKEFVELHGGHISVSSIENKGSTFSIKLPYKNVGSVPKVSGDNLNGIQQTTDDKVTGSEKENTSFAFPEGEKQAFENTLLLVEDNPDMRVFIRESLEEYYNIVEASDGQEGIDKALDIIPDIIISDVMMPKKDGLHLCQTLKKDIRTNHIPIILLTAKADIESRLAGLECGADDYLAKPFNRKEILIRAKNLLEIRKRLWERNISTASVKATTSEAVEVEDEFLVKIRTIVEENLAESEFEIENFSQLAGMSRSQLFRKIKALTGMSPSLFIRTLRLQKAKELLHTTGLNVSEVAYRVGFTSPGYFSDAYAEMYNIRPSQVKK